MHRRSFLALVAALFGVGGYRERQRITGSGAPVVGGGGGMTDAERGRLEDHIFWSSSVEELPTPHVPPVIGFTNDGVFISERGADDWREVDWSEVVDDLRADVDELSSSFEEHTHEGDVLRPETLEDVDHATVRAVDVGHVRMDSWRQEDGSFEQSSGGDVLIEFDHRYRVLSESVGANEGDGSATWFEWQTDAEGYYTGMVVSCDIGIFSSITVNWSVTGNIPRDDWESGA